MARVLPSAAARPGGAAVRSFPGRSAARRRLAFALVPVLLLAGAAGWVGWAGDVDPAAAVPRAEAGAKNPGTLLDISVATPRTSPAALIGSIAQTTAEAAPQAPPCAIGRPMRLEIDRRVHTLCAEAAHEERTGDLVALVVPAAPGAAWRLRIEQLAGSVSRVQLTGAAASRYECVAEQCWGVLWRDPRAGRAGLLAFEGLRLLARDEVPEGADEAQLSLQLPLEGGTPVPADACGRSGSLQVHDTQGVGGAFCASGGAGFEILDDGTQRFRFHDRAGHTLLVSVRDGRRVEQVEFDGTACQHGLCEGASVDAATAAEEPSARTFSFAHTVLRDAEGRSWRLEGQLVMAPP